MCGETWSHRQLYSFNSKSNNSNTMRDSSSPLRPKANLSLRLFQISFVSVSVSISTCPFFVSRQCVSGSHYPVTYIPLRSTLPSPVLFYRHPTHKSQFFIYKSLSQIPSILSHLAASYQVLRPKIILPSPCSTESCTTTSPSPVTTISLIAHLPVTTISLIAHLPVTTTSPITTSPVTVFKSLLSPYNAIANL